MAKKRKRKNRWIQGALKIGRHRYGKGPHHRKSIRVGALHKGTLHRYYERHDGIAVDEPIPYVLLQRDKHKTGKIGSRVRFALNVKRRKKAKR